MKTKIWNLLTGAMLVVMVSATGCGKHASTTAGDNGDGDDQGSLETRVDQHGDEVMASTTKAEAREWMKQSSHIFFKADSKQVGRYVEEFYGAGATQVFIADIEEHEGKQFGEALLVVLPKDAATRAKLFEIDGRAETDFENDKVSDKGQKYLYYSLD